MGRIHRRWRKCSHHLLENDPSHVVTWVAGVAVGTPPSPQTSLPSIVHLNTRILDVARDFPHCSCVAVDLVPMQVV